MHRVLGTDALRVAGNGNGNAQDNRMFEMLEGIERNLNDLVQGLGLLGVLRCSRCKRFFRSGERGSVFSGAGELVCFGCIPTWWPARREQLSCVERQRTECDLVFWLRTFHNARSYKGSEAPEGDLVNFELVTNCLECRGTGICFGDKRCRHCAGPGTVRVIVPKQNG